MVIGFFFCLQNCSGLSCVFFCGISEAETRTDLNNSRILREIDVKHQKMLGAQKECIWKEGFFPEYFTKRQ